MRRRDSLRRKPILILTALCCAMPLAALAQDSGCAAELDIEETERQAFGDGQKVLFSVEVSANVDCAEVEYDVVVEQREPNDQVHRVRIPMVARLRIEITQIVEHVVPPGHELLDYEVQFVSCEPCDAEPEP